MNTERLQALQESLKTRNEDQFDQNMNPKRAQASIGRWKTTPDCGCVFWDFRSISGIEIKGDDRWTEDLTKAADYFDIPHDAAYFIFGAEYYIQTIAEDRHLKIPENFGPMDAIDRIQMVIDGHMD